VTLLFHPFAISIDDFKSKPPDCTYASSPSIYNPSGHVITGDIKIINNTSLRDVFAKGLKFREPKSINWKHNLKIRAHRSIDFFFNSDLYRWPYSFTHLRFGKSTSKIHVLPIVWHNHVAKHLSLLHDKYVIVSADKAPNNIVCVCKSHYEDCFIKELGIDNSFGNPAYTPTTLTFKWFGLWFRVY
jgi:hypothetical protein